MINIDDLLSKFINDTIDEFILWSIVGEWGGSSSLDYRCCNSILQEMTDKHPFLFDGWNNVLVAESGSGFVHLIKHPEPIPYYSIHLQADSSSKPIRVNADIQKIEELYNIAYAKAFTAANYDIGNFVMQYNNSHTLSEIFDENDEMYIKTMYEASANCIIDNFYQLPKEDHS